MSPAIRLRKINLVCGICSEVLWTNLQDYVQDSPSQPHLAAEIYTNIPPTSLDRLVDKSRTAGCAKGLSLNCSNDCHPDKWLIDAGTGIVDRKGFKYAAACSPTTVRIELAEDPVSLVLKASIAWGKIVAGLVRFVFEDLYNGIVQTIYLCKVWHKAEMTNASRAFILLSVLSGLVCSLSGPAHQTFIFLRLKGQRRKGENSLDDFDYQSLPTEKLSVDTEDMYAVRTLTVPEGVASAHVGVGTPGKADLQSRAETNDVQPFDMSVRQFLYAQDDVRSHCARRMLLVAAILYWSSNIGIFLSFHVECGGALPTAAWMIFFPMTMSVMVIEVWVLIHARQGYSLFRNCDLPFLMAVGFGCLGRFDTFGDVGATLAIQSCTKAGHRDFYTWFSIWSHRFPLPTDLGTMMTLGLIMICSFQMLPGLVLLCREKWLPVAYKLNELTLILAAMDRELLAQEASEVTEPQEGPTRAGEDQDASAQST